MSLTAEQNIVAVLKPVHAAALDGQSERLGQTIVASAKSSQLFGPDDRIRVRFVQMEFEDGSIEALMILPDEKKENFGQQLYTFKQAVLKLLQQAGIAINGTLLHVDFRSGQEICRIISRANAVTQGKRSEDESSHRESSEYDYEQRAKKFVPTKPLYSFNRVILPKNVISKIEEAIAVLSCEHKVFQEWGLYEIQPHPSTSLSFYGPPGTGKTMAAEAVAEKLGKNILKVSYADVESKYHGEGPKMVKAIFLAAERNDAVLFFDEADSLLSKRLTDVSQGSEQAINSMRSQLLICLEEFHGIVIFATNLVVNYDKAFLTRLISVEFPIPDAETRKRIWDVHIRPANDGYKHQLNIPLAADVNTAELAAQYNFVGREIRNAVINSCVNAAMNGKTILSQSDFLIACDNISKERNALTDAKDRAKVAAQSQDILSAAIFNTLK